jgi:hypothetical protein
MDTRRLILDGPGQTPGAGLDCQRGPQGGAAHGRRVRGGLLEPDMRAVLTWLPRAALALLGLVCIGLVLALLRA